MSIEKEILKLKSELKILNLQIAMRETTDANLILLESLARDELLFRENQNDKNKIRF